MTDIRLAALMIFAMELDVPVKIVKAINSFANESPLLLKMLRFVYKIKACVTRVLLFFAHQIVIVVFFLEGWVGGPAKKGARSHSRNFNVLH